MHRSCVHVSSMKAPFLCELRCAWDVAQTSTWYGEAFEVVAMGTVCEIMTHYDTTFFHVIWFWVGD